MSLGGEHIHHFTVDPDWPAAEHRLALDQRSDSLSKQTWVRLVADHECPQRVMDIADDDPTNAHRVIDRGAGR
jgi:hypothetical protein